LTWPSPLPETVHVLGADERCDWCEEPWPCAFEQEVDYERRQGALLCTCGHQRARHHCGALGIDGCVVVDFSQGPPWKRCRCLGFRRSAS
jgi:hypothetical protein